VQSTTGCSVDFFAVGKTQITTVYRSKRRGTSIMHAKQGVRRRQDWYDVTTSLLKLPAPIPTYVYSCVFS
jgi:hypothetical protein